MSVRILLLEDVPATPSAVADAVGTALVLRARSATKSQTISGGPAVTIDFGGWHARPFALLNPTAILSFSLR